MARTGPVTKDTSSLALGLAQIRVGKSAEHIGKNTPVLTEDDSVGALSMTKYTNNVEYWRHLSGFPQMEDHVIPLRETSQLECQMEEFSPRNIALAQGIDPSTYTDVHRGTIRLGAALAPVFVRMEAVFTFPDGVNTATFIFPRAQVTSSMELDFQTEDRVIVPVTFEAKRADGDDGNSVWHNSPLGVIIFSDTTV